jgi:hypothetical protein
MNAQGYWQLFLMTGSPEAYLLYNEARKTEERNVFDGSGLGAQSNTIQ